MFVLSTTKNSELKAAVKLPGARISNPSHKQLQPSAQPCKDAHSKSAYPKLKDLPLTVSHLKLRT